MAAHIISNAPERTASDFGDCIILKTSVEWSLKCADFYFWQGTMRRNNALLQRIVTQQKLKSGVL